MVRAPCTHPSDATVQSDTVEVRSMTELFSTLSYDSKIFKTTQRKLRQDAVKKNKWTDAIKRVKHFDRSAVVQEIDIMITTSYRSSVSLKTPAVLSFANPGIDSSHAHSSKMKPSSFSWPMIAHFSFEKFPQDGVFKNRMSGIDH